MINIEITAFYAGLLALLFMVLTINIIRLRLKLQVGVGDGEQPDLVKAIRIHGNFAEYVPLFLLLMGCYELNQGSALLLHCCGGAVFVGRILHAIGLAKTIGTSIYRQMGMLTVFISIFVLAEENIRLFILGA
jgi:hypothetical protein